MKLTGVRMPDEMKASATARAKTLRRSFGNYLRDLIAKDLERSGEADLQAAPEIQKKKNREAKKDVVNGMNEVRKATKKK